MTAWTPENNRIQTMHLTADELAALKAAKHGVLFWSDLLNKWMEIDVPTWTGDRIYRAKPAPAPKLSITVNGVTNVVAAPVTEALEAWQAYWVAYLGGNDWTIALQWRGDRVDLRYLERGLVHTSEAAARAHAMAMVGLKAEGV